WTRLQAEDPKDSHPDLQLWEDGLYGREIGEAVEGGRAGGRQEVEEGRNPDQERGGDCDTEHRGISEPRREDPPGGGGKAAAEIDVRARAVPRPDPQDAGPQDR